MCEDIILHGRVMYTNGASADLDAVQNEIIMLPSNLHGEKRDNNAHVR